MTTENNYAQQHLKKMAGEVRIRTVVQLIKFGGYR